MSISWPVAYFISFRTYATWLPGDDRGWVDVEHNLPNTPPRAPNRSLRAHAKRVQRADPMILDQPARAVVDRTIREVCTHRRWALHALSVRTNHVHAVVVAEGRPEPVMSALKSWCTRRLREAELVRPSAPVWSRHGSTRYLWDEASFDGACMYVSTMQ